MISMDISCSTDNLPEEHFSINHCVLLVVSNMSFRLYGLLCTIWLCNVSAGIMNDEHTSQTEFQMNDYSW